MNKIKKILTKHGLAFWAVHKFGLPAPPSQYTTSRIPQSVGAASKHTILRGVSTLNRLTGNPQLEQALHKYINGQFAVRRNFDDAVILEATKRSQDRTNNAVPTEKRVNTKFSNGWLQKIQATAHP